MLLSLVIYDKENKTHSYSLKYPKKIQRMWYKKIIELIAEPQFNYFLWNNKFQQ